ncbi:ATP-dependent RNA helicase mak5 [Golovinomyces cichoracearum]|uniref:ATP-dependent RNA helicase n=1 Tax=Golovinomyces cichoracearum TaxID=62708 RepID=A0A420IY17_9PEZI|nr:ATP-dependent RNA helicase mak5 [Golovinomyces cichoracearum]
MANKRARLVSNLSTQSVKRPRLGKFKNPEVKKKQVALDTLPWSQCEVPGLDESAEGFIGLEEVDNVEVVREGEFLKFITTAAQSGHADDVFEGFDDDSPTSKLVNSEHRNINLPKPAIKQTNKKDTVQKTRKTLIDKKVNGKGKDSLLHDSPRIDSFKALSAYDGEETEVSAWVELNLSSSLLISLSKLGFSKPTPIQSATIPEIFAGHDVVGKASTGSGKTLAFAIPIVDSWLKSNRDLDEAKQNVERSTIALILSPTRELAHQLAEHITRLCKGLPDAPQIATVIGGLSVQKQQRQLPKSDIIIGTPGRLWEVISSDHQTLKNIRLIKFLVIDEADRLLAEGHFKEVEQILSILNPEQVDHDENQQNSPIRQTLVFSATFEKHLQQKLARKGKKPQSDGENSIEYLLNKLKFRNNEPKFIDVNPISQMAENLREGIVECSGIEKDLYLYSLLLYHPNKRTLIFTNSIHSVRRLTPMLQNLGLNAQALHSQMVQKARIRSIERFSSPNSVSPILVATDVAARGLDIKGVDLVIHYHLPRAADMYVHRSGRTARAEATGTSILMCAPEEVVGMRRLVAKVHAQNAMLGTGSKSKYYMKSLNLNRKIVTRLKPRVSLAKQIADSAVAKQKKGHDSEWLKTAAEELGVDYNSDEFEAINNDRKGRGTGRKLKEKVARALTKNELYTLKEGLKSLLAQRVNVGISERYLASGNVNVNELLVGTKGDFLGPVDEIFIDDL